MNIQNTIKKYYSDKHIRWSCQYHVIFCTKYNRKVLSPDVIERLKKIVLGNQELHNYNILEIEVHPDHVHLLLEVNPKVGIHTAISLIKGSTSNLLRKEFSDLRTKLPTLWTRHKFISTVGTLSLESIQTYIEEQKKK